MNKSRRSFFTRAALIPTAMVAGLGQEKGHPEPVIKHETTLQFDSSFIANLTDSQAEEVFRRGIKRAKERGVLEA